MVKVMSARDELRRRESLLTQAFEPYEMLRLGQQGVGSAVACQIDEPDIWIGQVETGEGLIGPECFPGFI